jgi:hypothetical protein
MAPASVMMMAMAEAKIGRSMKKPIMARPPQAPGRMSKQPVWIEPSNFPSTD